MITSAPRAAVPAWHFFGVVGIIPTDAAGLFVPRDLIQQIGENRRIANCVRDDFERPNVQRFGVDADMRLAPLAAI